MSARGGAGGGGGAGACCACLSRGRALRGLRQLAPVYTELLQTNLMPAACVDVSVCWECDALLRRISNFKQRAMFAQQVLTYSLQDVDSITSTSTLDFSPTKSTFDFTHTHKEIEDLPEYFVPFECEGVKIEFVVKQECSEANDDAAESGVETDNLDYEGRSKASSVFVWEQNMNPETECIRQDQCVNPKVPVSSAPQGNITNTTLKETYADVEQSSYYGGFDSEGKKRKYDLRSKYEILRISHEEMLKNREIGKSRPIYAHSPYKCDDCVLFFKVEDNFKQHNKCHEPQEGLTSCDICRVTNILPDMLEQHREEHYLQYKCVECNYTNMREDIVELHIKKAHVRPTWQCSKCDDTFPSYYKLKYHLRSHKEPLQCDHCKKKFSHRSRLVQHIKTIHTDKPLLPCPVCHKLFTSRGVLDTHMKLRHEKSDQLHQCVDCDKTFLNELQLRKHIKYSKVHAGGEGRFECTECDKKFHYKNGLKGHYEYRHLGMKSFKCDLCDKTFASRKGRKTHFNKVHKGYRPPRIHTCEECGLTFTAKTILASHKLIHTGERPFKCNVCGDDFRQSGSLHTHNRLKHLKQKRVKKNKNIPSE